MPKRVKRKAKKKGFYHKGVRIKNVEAYIRYFLDHPYHTLKFDPYTGEKLK